MKPSIDFYFDFSSPCSYIASEWISNGLCIGVVSALGL
jgi:2-hydroxychromene-2-carboxylate isomerase